MVLSVATSACGHVTIKSLSPLGILDLSTLGELASLCRLIRLDWRGLPSDFCAAIMLNISDMFFNALYCACAVYRVALIILEVAP